MPGRSQLLFDHQASRRLRRVGRSVRSATLPIAKRRAARCSRRPLDASFPGSPRGFAAFVPSSCVARAAALPLDQILEAGGGAASGELLTSVSAWCAKTSAGSSGCRPCRIEPGGVSSAISALRGALGARPRPQPTRGPARASGVTALKTGRDPKKSPTWARRRCGLLLSPLLRTSWAFPHSRRNGGGRNQPFPEPCAARP